jgi:hypothetical protein
MSQQTILQMLKGVLSAFMGVQAKENRELDFSNGKAGRYIIIGIAMAVLFILTLVFVVSLVLGV